MFKCVLLLVLPVTFYNAHGLKSSGDDNGAVSLLDAIGINPDGYFEPEDYDTLDVYGNTNNPDVGTYFIDTIKDTIVFDMVPRLTYEKPSPKLAPVSYCDKSDQFCLTCSPGRECVHSKDGRRKYYETSRFACSALDPYCASERYSSSPDSSCFDLPNAIESTKFHCMRDGFYPDPKNCNKYYYCKNKKAYEQKCGDHPAPYYHPRLKYCGVFKDFCASETSANFCKQRENFGRKVPVLFTSNYFMYCGVNKNVLTVDRCIGAYFYDPGHQLCRFVCPYKGVFPSMEDCSKYIECMPLHQGGLVRKDRTCPPGQAFSEWAKGCVDRSLVSNCNQANPDSFEK